MYQEQADYVYNLAFRLCGSKSDADDVFQDAFIRVYRFLPGFRGDSLRGWLRRIVMNAFHDARHKVRRLIPVEEPAQADLADVSDEPGAILEQKGLDGTLERALARLPDEHRSILVLRAIDDLSYEEMAEALDVPVGTVRSRLSRARTALRKLLEDSSQQPPVKGPSKGPGLLSFLLMFRQVLRWA